MANSDFLKAWLPFDSSPTDDNCGNSWTAVNSPSIASDNAISGNALQLSGGAYLQSDNKILIGGQDFTVDFWAYGNSSQVQYAGFFALVTNYNSQIASLILCRNNRNSSLFCKVCASDSASVIGNQTIDINFIGVRHHYEIDYLHSQRQFLIFVDGVLASTINLSAEYARLERYVYIGRTAWGASQYFNGSIDEFRVFDGVALHTGNFTPPIFNGVIDLDSSFDLQRKVKNNFLLKQYSKVWLRFNEDATADVCGNVWTAHNDPTISSNNSFYSNALQLDGEYKTNSDLGQYLSLDAGITLGGKDFTIDGWSFMDSSVGNYARPFAFFNSFGTNGNKALLLEVSGSGLLLRYDGSSTSVKSDLKGTLFHFAVVYEHSKTLLSFYANGTLVGTIQKEVPETFYTYCYIGRANYKASDTWYYKGTIDEFRIFDGLALWTNNFSPPTVEDFNELEIDFGRTIDFDYTFDSNRQITQSLDLSFDTLRDVKADGSFDFSIDFDTSKNIHKSFSFDFNSNRNIEKSSDFNFDTLRKFKTVWRYENFGTADLLTVNGYTVALEDAIFKQAFYQTERVKCFDIPATNDIWIKFDLFHKSGISRFRVFDDSNGSIANGLTLTITMSREVALWSYDGSKSYERLTFFDLLIPNTIQTWILHMKSGTSDGILELWCDGVFIDSWIGNVNNGVDFSNIYLQSDNENNLFSNVIVSNSQIALTDNASMPLDIDFDTKRILFAPVDFSDNFDTKLQIFQSVNFNADSLRHVVKSVDDTFDTHRFIVRTVNFDVDTLRKIPFKFFVTPATNKIVFDSTISAGLQYLEISLSAGQLIDQLSFATTNPIDMLQQVQGQILDYKFNYRVEDLDQRGILNSCKCCSDIDELLYTQIAYTLSKTNWNGGTYAVDSKKSTVTSTTFIMLDKPHGNAAAHAISIAKKLTLDTVCLFDDFTSTVDVKQEGVTYQDLISEIFNWSLRVPHKLINLFIRDHTLYIIQRGHEQNTITLNNSDFAQDFVIHKSLIRTSFGVTRNSQSIERSNGSNNKKGHYEPILGSPLPEEYQDPPDDDDETPPPPEPTEPARNLPDHVTTVENGITTDINYDYDDDGNLIKTTTTTIGGDIDTLIIVTNHYSNINGEKLLDKETTDEYEAEYRNATNPAGESFTQRIWNWVDGKVIYHTYTTVGQQHISSVSSDGSVNGSVTATARHNDKPTPFDDKHSSESAIDNFAENHNYQPNSIYTYQNGVKIEVVGYQWVDDSVETNNTITGTLETVKLYDSSFPVNEAKARQITNDLKWLNRKIQETVSGTIYNFKHIFDFNDKFILNGNIYFLQSNSFVMTDNFTNKQFIQLVRWY